jgi:conjugative transfer region protein TrbK
MWTPLRLLLVKPPEHRDAVGLLLRAATLAFVGAAIAVAIHQSRRDGDERADVPSATALVDPLAAELARCRTITPEQNAADDSCRRAWAESRRRFFAPASPRADAVTDDPTTAPPGKDQSRLPSAGVQLDRGEAH